MPRPVAALANAGPLLESWAMPAMVPALPEVLQALQQVLVARVPSMVCCYTRGPLRRVAAPAFLPLPPDIGTQVRIAPVGTSCCESGESMSALPCPHFDQHWWCALSRAPPP